MRIIKLCSFITLLLLIFWLFPYKTAIVFEKENSKDVLAYHPINKDEKFAISYTHSIHLTEVVEQYKVTSNGEILQTGLVYENYGIGMPSNSIGNEKLVSKDGKIYITNMERSFPFLDIRIGQVVANHHLMIENYQFQLEKYMPPGSWVRIKFRKLNVFEVLKGVNINEG